MENNTVTVKDVLESCLADMRQINIPASIGPTALMNLSLPIARVMNNLELCLKAIKDEHEKDDPKIEIVGAGETNSIPNEEPIIPSENG